MKKSYIRDLEFPLYGKPLVSLKVKENKTSHFARTWCIFLFQATKRQPGASGRLHRTVTGEWVWSSEEEGDRSSDEEVVLVFSTLVFSCFIGKIEGEDCVFKLLRV